MAKTLRQLTSAGFDTKGSALTYPEVDTNFIELKADTDAVQASVGTKVTKGGDTDGADLTIGTNDGNDVVIVTAGIERLRTNGTNPLTATDTKAAVASLFRGVNLDQGAGATAALDLLLTGTDAQTNGALRIEATKDQSWTATATTRDSSMRLRLRVDNVLTNVFAVASDATVRLASGGVNAALPTAGSGSMIVFPDKGGDPTMDAATAGLYAKTVSGTTSLHLVDSGSSVRLRTTTDGIAVTSVVTLGGGLRLLGYTSAAADPTTGELPADKDCAIHKNTSSGDVFLAFNDGGSTIKKVLLPL